MSIDDLHLDVLVKLKRFPQMQLKYSFSQICAFKRQKSVSDAFWLVPHDALGDFESSGISEFSQLTHHMSFISISCETEMCCEES